MRDDKVSLKDFNNLLPIHTREQEIINLIERTCDIKNTSMHEEFADIKRVTD